MRVLVLMRVLQRVVSPLTNMTKVSTRALHCAKSANMRYHVAHWTLTCHSRLRRRARHVTFPKAYHFAGCDVARPLPPPRRWNLVLRPWRPPRPPLPPPKEGPPVSRRAARDSWASKSLSNLAVRVLTRLDTSTLVSGCAVNTALAASARRLSVELSWRNSWIRVCILVNNYV